MKKFDIAAVAVLIPLIVLFIFPGAIFSDIQGTVAVDTDSTAATATTQPADTTSATTDIADAVLPQETSTDEALDSSTTISTLSEDVSTTSDTAALPAESEASPETTPSGDVEPPVIILNGETVVNLTPGDVFVDPGATAVDDADGDISGLIVVLNKVVTTVPGSYMVTYNVSDKAGNAAVEAVRVVNVTVSDITPPSITLNGDSLLIIAVDSVYTDQGASALDDIDGDITSSITVVNTVNTAVTGSYTVTYNVSDTAGNPAVEVIRTVNVVSQPTIFTDKPDYLPTDYVLVTGSGWLPGETVKLDFHETLLDPIFQQTITYYTVADSEGNIRDYQYLIEMRHLGASFILLATGQISGLEAQTSFTDAGCTVNSVTVGTQIGTANYKTVSTVTYTVLINATTVGEDYEIRFNVTNLPTGATYSFSPNTITFIKNRTNITLQATLTVHTTADNPTGSSTFTVTTTGATNNKSGNGILVISQRAITVTAATDTKTYDGTASSTGVPTITSGSLIGGDTVTWTQTFSNKNAGTSKALTPAGTVSDGNSGNNYAVTFVTNTTGTITARPITVTAVTNTKVYDGTTAALSAPTISSGTLATGDTSNFLESYDTKNIGTGKTLTPAGTANDGNSGSNYAVTFVNNTTGTITVRPITVTAVTDTKAYDDTTESYGVPTITSGSLAAGDTATWTQTFDNDNIGTGKTLTPAGTVNDGNGGVNYAVTFVTNTTGVIADKMVLVISADAKNKVYGSADPPLTYVIHSGTLLGDDTLAGSLAREAGENAGTHEINQGTLLVYSNGEVDDNYIISFIPADLTITARPITVTAATDTKNYDGTTSSIGVPTITSGSLVTGDTEAWTQTFDNKDKGTGKTLTPAGTVNDGNSGNNYAVTFAANTTGVINQRSLTIYASVNGKIYDGTDTAIVNTFSDNRVAGDEFTVDYDSATFDTKNAGTGKTATVSGISISGIDAENYTSNTSCTAAANISKRPITVTAATDTKTYDGTASSTGVPTITSGSLIGGDTVTWTQTFSNKNAGTSKALTPAGTVSDGNSGNNYAVTFVTNTTGTITARPITVTAVTNTKVYDGTTAALSAPTISSGTLATGDTSNFLESYDTKNIGTGKTLTPAGTANDGNSGSNYAVTFVNNTTGTITVRPITVTAVTDTKAYDDTTESYGVPTITSGSLAAGDTATWTQTFDNDNIGTGKTLTPAGTVNDGNGGVNYAVTFVTNTTGVIADKMVLVISAVAKNKVYGGNDPELTYVIHSGTLLGDDTLSGLLAREAGENVGTHEINQGALLVYSQGEVDDNYIISFIPADLTITARSITVTAATDTKTYDGTTSSTGTPSITSGSLVTGDTAAWTQTFDDKNTGTGKTITAAGTANDGNSGNNYAVTFAANTTGVINQRSLTIDASVNGKIYDGADTAIVDIFSDNRVAGDEFTVAYDSAAFDTKNAGTGKTATVTGISISGIDAENYTSNTSCTAAANISKRPITVTAATDTKTYDGTTSSTGTPIITSGSLIGGDTVTWTQTFSNKNAGTSKALTPAGTVSDGNSGNNYAVTFVTNTTGTITARPITVTAVTNTKVYDGTTAALSAPTISSGTLATGDTSNFLESYDTKNTGTGKTLTPAGTVSDGNSGSNYAVTFVNNTTGTITGNAVSTEPSEINEVSEEEIGPTGPNINEKPLSDYNKTNPGFVTLLYNRFLNRAPDEEGLGIFVARLNGETLTGDDLVNQFIFGKECQGIISNYTNEQFITFLYKALFNREPDLYGFNAWTVRMGEGMTKEGVVNGFTHSLEFGFLCENFNIKPYTKLLISGGTTHLYGFMNTVAIPDEDLRQLIKIDNIDSNQFYLTKEEKWKESVIPYDGTNWLMHTFSELIMNLCLYTSKILQK